MNLSNIVVGPFQTLYTLPAIKAVKDTLSFTQVKQFDTMRTSDTSILLIAFKHVMEK